MEGAGFGFVWCGRGVLLLEEVVGMEELTEGEWDVVADRGRCCLRSLQPKALCVPNPFRV